jgi:regulation of enolase protein 1 (concanavalin A-like superfamily)
MPDRLIARDTFQAILIHPPGSRITNGELEGATDAAFLRITRVGKEVRGARSRDGKKWTDLTTEEVNWPEVVKVGVYVKHHTDAPFEVIFDEYKLTKPKK